MNKVILFIHFCIILLESHCSFAVNVLYIWSGSVTPTSANVRAKLDGSAVARMAISTSTTFISVTYGNSYTVDASTNFMASLPIEGLTANTLYYYRVELDGILDPMTGSFLTISYAPYSFSFVLSSCARSSNHVVYPVMDNLNPAFYVNIGDLHYINPNSTDVNVHRNAYETAVLSQPPATNFFQNRWFAYVWDDHDFAGNDSDSLSTGRISARQAYREYIPHFPLPAGSGDRAIYQAFTVGRVRFILSDLRSSRISGNKQMSQGQNTWLRNEFLQANLNRQIIFWASSVSFAGNDTDNWGGFSSEREEIADFLRDNNIKNMMIMCGDAHMIAIDDGTNSDFSTVMPNPNLYPIVQASALNGTGSYKGGTYSEGFFFNPTNTDGQFALIKVTDNGGADVCIEIDGIRTDAVGNTSTLVTYNFCRNVGLPILLPLSLTLFEGKNILSNTNKLTWQSLDESNVLGYEVQKSFNGEHFIPIAFQKTYQQKEQNTYTFTDTEFFRSAYYRLKIIEKGNNSQYSRTIFVKKADDIENWINIYPNPIENNQLKIKLPQNIQNFVVEFLTLEGRLVYQIQINNMMTENVILLPATIQKGVYLCKIKTASNTYLKKLILL